MKPKLTPAGRCRVCGAAQVRFDTNGMGHLVEVPDSCSCPWPPPRKPKPRRQPRTDVDHDRRRAAICQHCDEPVVGKPKVALYCETHRKEARAAAQERHRIKTDDAARKRYQEQNREVLNARARERLKDPEVRRRRNEYKRAWRKLNRDKIRAQKQRHALRNFRTNGEPVKRWRAEVEAGVRKPKRARRNRKGQRLCLTPGCRSVMTGRAKLCVYCKHAQAKEARAQLPLPQIGRAA